MSYNHLTGTPERDDVLIPRVQLHHCQSQEVHSPKGFLHSLNPTFLCPHRQAKGRAAGQEEPSLQPGLSIPRWVTWHKLS